MQENDPTWLVIKARLDEKITQAMDGLTHLSNDRDTDILYKAKIAICKELLKLPQDLQLLSANKRGN